MASSQCSCSVQKLTSHRLRQCGRGTHSQSHSSRDLVDGPPRAASVQYFLLDICFRQLLLLKYVLVDNTNGSIRCVLFYTMNRFLCFTCGGCGKVRGPSTSATALGRDMCWFVRIRYLFRIFVFVVLQTARFRDVCCVHTCCLKRAHFA